MPPGLLHPAPLLINPVQVVQVVHVVQQGLYLRKRRTTPKRRQNPDRMEVVHVVRSGPTSGPNHRTEQCWTTWRPGSPPT